MHATPASLFIARLPPIRVPTEVWLGVLGVPGARARREWTPTLRRTPAKRVEPAESDSQGNLSSIPWQEVVPEPRASGHRVVPQEDSLSRRGFPVSAPQRCPGGYEVPCTMHFDAWSWFAETNTRIPAAAAAANFFLMTSLFDLLIYMVFTDFPCEVEARS